MIVVLQGKAEVGAVVHMDSGDYRVVKIIYAHDSITPNASSRLVKLEPVEDKSPEPPRLRLVVDNSK